jgi:hypothetical protein
MPAIDSHRRDPLTSGAYCSVATSNTMLAMKTNSATRRTQRGGNSEVAISTTNAGIKNSTWRLTKWNGSRPMRTATGGLAASDSTMPPSISAAKAASIRRSTVYHHSPNGVRLARETMWMPRECLRLVVRPAWFPDR